MLRHAALDGLPNAPPGLPQGLAGLIGQLGSSRSATLVGPPLALVGWPSARAGVPNLTRFLARPGLPTLTGGRGALRLPSAGGTGRLTPAGVGGAAA
ncbi:hypothetical protein JNW88_28085, partial [Micromonospora sp. ATA32]|nr:hypothetical protein [Micromonospora sp. ATA32]